jgi:hypothetical protein
MGGCSKKKVYKLGLIQTIDSFWMPGERKWWFKESEARLVRPQTIDSFWMPGKGK